MNDGRAVLMGVSVPGVDGDRLLTVQEAERLTGRKVATWRRDIFERRIPVVRIGRRQVRIQLSVIQEMVRGGYQPADQHGYLKKP